jgi:hypothetical protein
MMRKRTLLTSFSLGLVLPAGLVLAGPAIPTVIFSNFAASPTSDVPGSPGLKFKPGTGTATAFDRPALSPDGSRWVLGGFVDALTSADDIIVSGQGTTAAGAVKIARASEPVPFDPAVNWAILDTKISINNQGQIAFSGTTTAATPNRVIGRFDGATIDAPARVGGGSPVPGTNIGTTLASANMMNNGTVGYHATVTPSTPTKHIGVSGDTVVVDGQVTIPLNQQVAPDQAVNLMTANTWNLDGSGTNHLYRTTLTGPTASNAVVVYNNSVVLQLGAPVPGWAGNTASVSSVASEFGSLQLSRNGQHWAIRGAVNDGVGAANQTDFVLRNGGVVAATDQPITPGNPELWDDAPFAATFFLNTVNNNGDYVIGGTTSNVDQARNAVLVFNGTTEFLRESDPVDLDGNGAFDDDVFIDVFGNDDGVLTDDLRFYLVASLKNGAGTAVGNAFIAVQVPEPGAVSVLGIGALALLRRRRHA